MVVPTLRRTESLTFPQFDKDIRDVHLIYEYDAKDAEGNPEKWKYEMYVLEQATSIQVVHLES